jgi:hypothetical protein
MIVVLLFPHTRIADQKPYTFTDLLRSSILCRSSSQKTNHQHHKKYRPPGKPTTITAIPAKDTKTARMRGLCGKK